MDPFDIVAVQCGECSAKWAVTTRRDMEEFETSHELQHGSPTQFTYTHR